MNYTHRDIVFEELRTVLMNEYVDKVDVYNPKILEIGAGNASAKDVFDFMLLEPYSYITIDNESEYTDKTNIKMDAEDLKFDDNTFDFIFLSHTSEHFENPLKCWKEIYRVLKPNGLVFNASPYPCIHQILFGDINHLFVLNEFQMAKLLSTAGFNKFEQISVKKTLDKQLIPKEQDWNVIVVARK